MSKKKKTQKNKLDNIKSYQIERIDWEDHWSGNRQWFAAKDAAQDLIPAHVVSVGIVLAENKKAVIVSQNIAGNGNTADTTTILKSCIINRDKLGTINVGIKMGLA